MDFQLADKVFIVTGGTAGLGLATARVLVEEGARVLLCGRSEARFAAALAELGGDEGRVAFVAGDLADAELPARLVARATTRWGRLDGLMVSTGGPPPGAVLDTADALWRATFDNLFLGPVRLIRELSPHIGEGGAIALVLAMSAKEASPLIPLSNGMRPGLALLTKSFADELGPRNIRVNALLPGGFATERVKQLLGDAPPPLGGISLGRTGEPAEFGRIAAVLLSPVASYITGASIAIDGGLGKTI